MVIVEDGVFDAGGGSVAHEVLFPDAFRHPHAADFCLKKFLQVFGVRTNLTDSISRRNHGQDRLVESAAHDLNPSAGHESAKSIDIFRFVLDEPFHQAAARVQTDGNLRVAFEQLEKRRVAVPISAFEDTVKIPHRLMIVQSEDEANSHGESSVSNK